MQIVLSISAVLLSVVAIAIPQFSNPVGKGLKYYDLTSPANALKSQLQITADQDIRALLELQNIRNRKESIEKQATLVVHREAEYGGKKALFVRFMWNGIPSSSVEWFEKDADTGSWLPSYQSTYDMQDKLLATSIEQWKTSPLSAREKFEQIKAALADPS